MKKKADVEIQFNWIFVLIAGAVILFFFVSIINTQKKTSEEKLAQTSLTNLESILMGAETTPGTLHAIETPNIDTKFDCNSYYVGSTKKDIKDSVVFAPDLVKGKQMQVLTLNFDMPFRITNFVYVTHPNIRYIFVYNESDLGSKKLFEQVNSTLPDNFKREVYKSTDSLPSTPNNNYKVKVVFFYQPANPFNLSNLGRDVKALAINPSQANQSIIFYNFTAQKGWSYYLNTSTLIGAIFAEDKAVYDCATSKALKKTNIASQIYQKRTEMLMANFSSPHPCNGHYSNTNSSLEFIISYSSGLELNKGTLDTITSQANAIKPENMNLIYKSCPTIY